MTTPAENSWFLVVYKLKSLLKQLKCVSVKRKMRCFIRTRSPQVGSFRLLTAGFCTQVLLQLRTNCLQSSSELKCWNLRRFWRRTTCLSASVSFYKPSSSPFCFSACLPSPAFSGTSGLPCFNCDPWSSACVLLCV